MKAILHLPAEEITQDRAQFITKLSKEAQKATISASSAFVLIEWFTLLLEYGLHASESEDKNAKQIFVGLASALEICQGPTSRPTVKKTSLRVARRGLRKLFSVSQENAEYYIPRGVKMMASPCLPEGRNIILLGVFAGVCARKAEWATICSAYDKLFYEAYVKMILGSKKVVPPHIADGLHDFFQSFTDEKDLTDEVIKPLERALLRSPEIVLNNLVTPLIESLPTGKKADANLKEVPALDLSSIFKNSLMKPLLANVKSSNAAIRDGALSAFKAGIPRCKNETALSAIADEVLNPLKTGKVPAAEHRVLHAEMLRVFPISQGLADKLMPVLATIAGKEANESALNAELSTLSEYVSWTISNKISLPKPVLDAYAKGAFDKKAPLRRLWTLQIADILWAQKDEALTEQSTVEFAEATIPTFADLFNEVAANGLAAATSGLAVSAYALTALASIKLAPMKSEKVNAALKKAKILEQALVFEPKPSFLLNHRVYTKLTQDEEFVWLAKALSAVSIQAAEKGTDSPIAIAWSQGVISCICSAATKPIARRRCVQIISEAYAQAPKQISQMVINGLWHWVRQLEAGEKDCAAAASKTDKANLHHATRAICLSAADFDLLKSKVMKEIIEQQMVDLLVIARPELLPGINWIELCLRVGVDPGDLARRHADALLDQVMKITSFDKAAAQQETSAIRIAAFNACAELAFVAPETMTTRIVDLFKGDLDPKQLENVGPTEAAIFRTPEGTAFIDVLAKKNAQEVVPNKNTKDYDTLKWEAEVRAQLAAKKGETKKLTAEEKGKVDAQLKKESTIRLQVRVLEARLIRGVGIIKALAVGPPTEANLWMGPAVSSLVQAITAGAGLITGNSPAEAYRLLSEKVSRRMGPIRPFIGVATLRALNVTHLPDELTQEPLGELITRVLYRLRFSGEQRPFDTVSLTYILPLVFLVLQNGGFGNQDDQEAQVVLGLEFLKFHTDASSDTIVPRDQILTVLIESMQNYKQHYKTIKECLTDLCRCIAPTINDNEIAILARGAIVPEVDVRTSVLQSISAEIDMSEMPFSEEIFLACHDDVDLNVELGKEIWEESDFKVREEDVYTMLPYLEREDKQLRRAAARALAAAAQQHIDLLPEVLKRLEDSYIVLAKKKVQQLDEYGMPKKMDMRDPWEARNGIALAFRELSVVFNESLLDSFLQFLIERGPLGDKSASVRDEMVEAARAIIALHAKNKVEELMKTFEHTLEETGAGDEVSDRVNEAVIILYGALARHLNAGDNRVPKVVDRLIATLSTPSETVQYAVALCLPELVHASKDHAAEYIRKVLDELLNGKTYAARRGAAYGLAGLIKGTGIVALREYRIMMNLRSAIDNKKDAKHREGALLAYELMSTILGRVFEPYVIQIVPQLLATFGDANADVREGCLAAAKACFASLSSYGVMKILPTLLDGLDDDQWRSKKGACDLLGAMAYLDPQQLAISLPEIIPPLTGVLNDTHKEVRLAANRSLKRFGEVIQNPEIKSLVSILLKALSDPTKYTDEALDALIKVNFVHYLDAPSLALVVRILERGLGDRSGTKRKSAQVIGSLAHLTERKDLMAHLPILVAGLKVAAVDPVPTTRATGSKALGSLIEKLGEDALPDLIPGLMQTLKTDTGAGDRLGSAQALSEVLAGLGTSRLEETLPTILQNVNSSKASVREGFMSLFIFLPVCFGNSFANYLSKIIPPILTGLADEVESIRDTALRAGRLLVKNFATKSIDLLLPELERGLGDDNYRIRLSSVELVGDLLFNLTGITASAEDDEVEEGAREAGASLLEILGEEKRNKVLSELYICRCDTVGQVRTAAINVWKALVSGPKVLKDLVPTLSHLIISRLGSSNAEQKLIAGNALGELIRKAGDSVLATLLPTLEDGLRTSTDADARQGICIALGELISSAGEDSLEDHEKTLISVVRVALTDTDETVRDAAADAFDSMQQMFGKRAVDQVLPYLLKLLREEDEAENALNALLTLLEDNSRSRIILPNLLPTLVQTPMSAFNARALASLSSVAPGTMTKYLSTVINSLTKNIVDCKDEDLKEELETSLMTVLGSVDEDDGLNNMIAIMFELLKSRNASIRSIAGQQLGTWFRDTEVDYSTYNADIIRNLLVCFEDTEVGALKGAWLALNEFTKNLEKNEMEALVTSTRQTLRHIGAPGQDLPGFSLIPKGITAILPIFLQGLVNGSADQKTQSTLAISDIVDRTSPEGLKPSALIITGPLIRFASERSPEVKGAILLTLDNLLAKVPAALKPFLPQLQRTFAKALADPASETVRSRAAKALGKLIPLTARIDPLIAELCTGAHTSDRGIQIAMMKALYQVVSQAGKNMSPSSGSIILTLTDTVMAEDDEDMDTMIIVSNLFAALVKATHESVGVEKAAPIMPERAVQVPLMAQSILALNSVLKITPDTLLDSQYLEGLPAMLCKGIKHEEVCITPVCTCFPSWRLQRVVRNDLGTPLMIIQSFVAEQSILAAGKFLLLTCDPSNAGKIKFEQERQVYESLAAVIAPSKMSDSRRMALLVVKVVARKNLKKVKPHMDILVSPIFQSVRDPVIPVKLAAEAAWMAIFDTVGTEMATFEEWIGDDKRVMDPSVVRSMKDYFKRVTMKLAKAKKEQMSEGEWMGDEEEKEDRREVMSIGRVDLEEAI